MYLFVERELLCQQAIDHIGTVTVNVCLNIVMVIVRVVIYLFFHTLKMYNNDRFVSSVHMVYVKCAYLFSRNMERGKLSKTETK